MARLLTCGFEIQDLKTDSSAGVGRYPPDGWGLSTGSTTYDTSVFRSGAASLKIPSTTASDWWNLQFTGAALGRMLFCRVYWRYDQTQSANRHVMGFGNAAGPSFATIQVTSSDTLQLRWIAGGDVQVGVDSAVLNKNQWYCLEMRAVVGTGTADEVEARVNGISLGASGVVNKTDTQIFKVNLGENTAMNGSFWYDDAGVNDDQGSSQNSWLGEGKIVLLKPSSDSQVGSWTGGVGGVTNLFDAVNNTPPVGTATETDTTQIESIDSTGDNATDEYRGNCGTYTAAGIGSNDIITVIQAQVNHGEDVATNTKTGSFGGQSNPSWTYDAFTFGIDAGALGTFPAVWFWTNGTVQYNPVVTKGSNFIIAVRKTDSGTRVASVDFLGAYVEYVQGIPEVMMAPIAGGTV